MTDITTTVDRYLAAFNETDAERRRALVAEVFTEDAGYVDPCMTGRRPGRDRRDDRRGPGAVPRPPLRAGRRPRRPPRPRALLLALVADGGTRVATGLDVALVADDGRLRSVTGFLEPAAA